MILWILFSTIGQLYAQPVYLPTTYKCQQYLESFFSKSDIRFDNQLQFERELIRKTPVPKLSEYTDEASEVQTKIDYVEQENEISLVTKSGQKVAIDTQTVHGLTLPIKIKVRNKSTTTNIELSHNPQTGECAVRKVTRQVLGRPEQILFAGDRLCQELKQAPFIQLGLLSRYGIEIPDRPGRGHTVALKEVTDRIKANCAKNTNYSAPVNPADLIAKPAGKKGGGTDSQPAGTK